LAVSRQRVEGRRTPTSPNRVMDALGLERARQLTASTPAAYPADRETRLQQGGG
jgi:hypothetical protein